MICPPIFLNIRIRDDSEKFKLFLPLPLFLLLPFFLFLSILLFPIALIVTIVLWRKGWGFAAFKALWYIFKLYCMLRGMSIDVRSKGQSVRIQVI